MIDGCAKTPAPPYYAVIFTSVRSSDDRGYSAAADRMVALAAEMPGFLGIESARDGAGLGITVSYWADEASIAGWKAEAEHVAARVQGRAIWYDNFEVRVARVERAYGWHR